MELSAEASRLLGQLKDGAGVMPDMARGAVPVAVLRELYAAAGGDYDVQYFLAGYFETPSKILEDLSVKSDSPAILARLAENVRTPKPVLQQLARHGRVEVRQAVAAGKGISPQAALILSEDPDASVRAVLAENPSVTPRVQVILSQDPVPFVRANLLKVPKLDEEIQFALCDDVDVAVQAKALTAPRISAGCLLRWADGDEGLSQRMLLLRSQLPENVLESLLFSKDEEVKRKAISRKTLTEDELVGLARTGDEPIRRKLAAMTGLPPLVQDLLVEDPAPAVRLALCANASLGLSAVQALLAQDDTAVDDALAGNCAVPLRELAAGDDKRQAAMLRTAAARGILDKNDIAYLAEHGDDDVLYRLWYDGRAVAGVPPDTLRRLAHHALPSIRELAARSPELTIALMADLCGDDSTLVRLALSENPQTVGSFLKTLSEDADGRVARAARRSLAAQPQESPAAAEPPSPTPPNAPEDDGEEPAPTGKDGILRRFISKLGM